MTANHELTSPDYSKLVEIISTPTPRTRRNG